MSFVKFQAAEPSTPPAGTQVAVDDVGGDVFQRVKLDIGADGASSPVSLGNPMPISDAGGSVTVDGAVSVSNFPATYPVTDNGGSLTVDGTVAVSNFPAVQPVSDNGSSLTVDGTLTVTNTQATPLFTRIPPTSTDKDAFGRVRMSLPQPLGFGGFEYGSNSFFLESAVVGTGAVGNVVNSSAISLSTGGTAANARAIIQTRQFFRYIPGRSQLVRFTGVFATPTANVRQRAGYFSDRDGLFLEYDGTTLYFVRRSYTGGSADDVRVARADWTDPMNGTGPSGLDLDLELGTTWLAWIDMEWLGVGRYRFGFASPATGELITCYANAGTGQLTVPYMRTANLPLRYSIENTGTAAASRTLHWICYSVDTEGGDEGTIPLPLSVDNGVTPQSLANGTFKPVLALRAKTTGPNSVPNRGQIIIRNFAAFVSGNASSLFRLRLNPTTLTANGGAVTWTSNSALAEFAAFSAAGDTVAGGTVIGEPIYVAASASAKGSGSADLLAKLPLVYTELGSVQDVVVIEAAGIGATSAALCEIAYQELY